MKDMNRTILEIRRRGNQRLRMRKRIVQQLTAVCSAAVVWAAVIWAVPKGTPVSLDIEKSALPVETQVSDSMLTVPEVRNAFVRITGNGVDICSEDSGHVDALRDWIAGQKEAYNNASSYAADAAITKEATEDRTGVSVFRIFIEADGTCEEYLLSEWMLQDVDGNHAYPLTQSQYRELLALLGVPA